MIDVVKAHFDQNIPVTMLVFSSFCKAVVCQSIVLVARLNGEVGKPHFVKICKSAHTKNSNLTKTKNTHIYIFPKEA